MAVHLSQFQRVQTLKPEIINQWARLLTIFSIADGELSDQEGEILLDFIHESGLAGPSNFEELDSYTEAWMNRVGSVGAHKAAEASLGSLMTMAPPDIREQIKESLIQTCLIDGSLTDREYELIRLIDEVWNDLI